MKKSATDGHAAKLHRMTRNYGSAAGPSSNIQAPSDVGKLFDTGEATGFGADGDEPRARNDRPARARGGNVMKRADGGDASQQNQQQNQAQQPSPDAMMQSMGLKPAAGQRKRGGAVKHADGGATTPSEAQSISDNYTGKGVFNHAGMISQRGAKGAFAAGGAVRRRADGGDVSDVSSIEEANRDQAMASTSNRARGGRKNKGATHVNVIVAPQSGNSAPAAPALPVGGNPAVPPAAAMPPRPPMPPPGAGAPGMPPGAGAPPMMPPPGAVPPGMIPPRAKGGRVHADEKQDKALIKQMLKEEGLKPARAEGGRLSTQKHHMTAGALSGPGRLEKIGEKSA